MTELEKIKQEAVEHHAKHGGYPSDYIAGAKTRIHLLAEIERLKKENVIAREALVRIKQALKGDHVLLDLMQYPNIENEDGMKVVEYLDKPNGGNVAYIRYDAMVKRINTLLNDWKPLPEPPKI